MQILINKFMRDHVFGTVARIFPHLGGYNTYAMLEVDGLLLRIVCVDSSSVLDVNTFGQYTKDPAYSMILDPARLKKIVTAIVNATSGIIEIEPHGIYVATNNEKLEVRPEPRDSFFPNWTRVMRITDKKPARIELPFKSLKSAIKHVLRCSGSDRIILESRDKMLVARAAQFYIDKYIPCDIYASVHPVERDICCSFCPDSLKRLIKLDCETIELSYYQSDYPVIFAPEKPVRPLHIRYAIATERELDWAVLQYTSSKIINAEFS